jgi:hypothetical protein
MFLRETVYEPPPGRIGDADLAIRDRDGDERIEIAMLISSPKARAATPPRIRTRRISSVA